MHFTAGFWPCGILIAALAPGLISALTISQPKESAFRLAGSTFLIGLFALACLWLAQLNLETARTGDTAALLNEAGLLAGAALVSILVGTAGGTAFNAVRRSKPKEI
jgi:hypothetical protein